MSYRPTGFFSIEAGDVRRRLKTWPDETFQCVVTSPPYWGLRDYGIAGQLGLEKTPQEYVAKMVEVFEEVRRVLKDDGTLWLNIGDSYVASGAKGSGGIGKGTIAGGKGQATNKGSFYGNVPARKPSEYGMKPKDLAGIPWMLAFALRDAGWYLRSDIIWAKPNPMPESVTDRPTRAHEYLFLLTKSAKYYYDADAIKTPYAATTEKQFEQAYTGKATKDFAKGGAQNASAVKARIVDKQRGHGRRHAGFNERWDAGGNQIRGANKRSVWFISPKPFKGAHFATFPPDLVEPCILAGSRPGDVVLDPFCGSGTVGVVACPLGRDFIGLDLNAEYANMAENRIRVSLE